MFFFAIKEPKDRPNRKITEFTPVLSPLPPGQKNNALRAAQYNISFNGIGPAFFE